MNKEPNIDLDIDDNMNGILVIGCPECNNKSKLTLRSIKPNDKHECSCGYTIVFEGDDLRGMQKSLDDLKRTLDGFS